MQRSANVTDEDKESNEQERGAFQPAALRPLPRYVQMRRRSIFKNEANAMTVKRKEEGRQRAKSKRRSKGAKEQGEWNLQQA